MLLTGDTESQLAIFNHQKDFHEKGLHCIQFLLLISLAASAASDFQKTISPPESTAQANWINSLGVSQPLVEDSNSPKVKGALIFLEF